MEKRNNPNFRGDGASSPETLLTPMDSVVLLSGGLDSTANLAFSFEWDRPVLALTFDYGQRAAKAEIRAASAISRYYGIPHRVISLSWLGALGGSALTDQRLQLPGLAIDQLDSRIAATFTAKAVWVPNRNGVLIQVAAAVAESEGAKQVIVGFNAEEAVTFPDNSTAFIEATNRALAYSTSNGVRVGCYTDKKTKSEFVEDLRRLARPFPFDLIWSCYEGGEQPCEQCESCSRLARALRETG